MLPLLRERLLSIDRALELYGTATAAVAILLRERPTLEVLLMERAARDSDPWSGQWSLPGGRRHPGETLLETARRETEEEVGLQPEAANLIGCLAARSPANRPEVLVLPLAFLWDGGEPKMGPEVASVAWFPIAGLPASRAMAKIKIRSFEREMPAFVDGNRAIWGFTYRVLEDLLLPLG